MRVRHLFIRFLLPTVWRFSRKRRCAALQEISITEFDSAWQSLYAIQFIDDPRARATLFQHALDELSHADLFSELSQRYADGPLNVPVFTRDVLVDPEGGRQAIVEFLAAVHVGERDVNQDLAAYAAAGVAPEIKKVFQQIHADEQHHEEASIQTLIGLSGLSPRSLRWLLLKCSVKRQYKLYSQLMSKIGEIPLQLLLSLLYYVMGPVVNSSLQRRLRLPRAEQFRIVQLQHEDFARGKSP